MKKIRNIFKICLCILIISIATFIGCGKEKSKNTIETAKIINDELVIVYSNGTTRNLGKVKEVELTESCEHEEKEDTLVLNNVNIDDENYCSVNIKKCAKCDALSIEYNKPHNLTISTVESTCEEEGYSVNTCSLCGYISEKFDLVEKKEHNYIEEKYNINALEGCKESYFVLEKCSNCNIFKDPYFVDNSGHIRTEELTIRKIDSTCTSEGYYLFKCSNCQKENCKEIIPIKNDAHLPDETWKVTKQPTDSLTGEISGKCVLCNLDNAVLEIPNLQSTLYNKVFVIGDCKNPSKDKYSILLNNIAFEFSIDNEYGKVHYLNGNKIYESKIYTKSEYEELEKIGEIVLINNPDQPKCNKYDQAIFKCDLCNDDYSVTMIYVNLYSSLETLHRISFNGKEFWFKNNAVYKLDSNISNLLDEGILKFADGFNEEKLDQSTVNSKVTIKFVSSCCKEEFIIRVYKN